MLFGVPVFLYIYNSHDSGVVDGAFLGSCRYADFASPCWSPRSRASPPLSPQAPS